MKPKHLVITLVLFSTSYLLYGQKLHLDIYGKDVRETAKLSTIVFERSHENITSIYDETTRIQKTLYKWGYFENAIDSLVKKDRSYHVYFSLGTKTNSIKAKVDKRYMDVLKGLGLEIVNDSIQLKPETFEAVLYEISKTFEANGDPFSEVHFINIKTTGDMLLGELSISQTQTRTLDAIFVRGYEKFPLSFVRHIAKIKEGDVFNMSEITKKTEKLAALPYIAQIKPPEVLFSSDSTQLYIYLKRTNANYFDGFLGFAVAKETQKIKLNGYLNAKLLNNLNTGEELTVNWKNNGLGQSIFNTTAILPYIFKSAFGVNASLRIFRQDSTFTTTSTALSLNYNFNAGSRLGLGLENIESAALPEVVLPELNIADYNAFYLTSLYHYALRDDTSSFFNEKLTLDIAIAIGNRRISTMHTNQRKLYSDISYQWRLNTKNRIYIRNLTEVLFSNNYLYSEKYRFGGINTLRGFDENSLEATLYSIVNSEYRLILSKNMYLNSIFDVAYLEDDILKTKNTLYGFGFGFGITTSGGLLKINYAIGKSENIPIRFSDAKVHLSFSTSF